MYLNVWLYLGMNVSVEREYLRALELDQQLFNSGFFYQT